MIYTRNMGCTCVTQSESGYTFAVVRHLSSCNESWARKCVARRHSQRTFKLENEEGRVGFRSCVGVCTRAAPPICSSSYLSLWPGLKSCPPTTISTFTRTVLAALSRHAKHPPVPCSRCHSERCHILSKLQPAPQSETDSGGQCS